MKSSSGQHNIPAADIGAGGTRVSFRDELDALVFPIFSEMASCQRLMQEIAERDGFIPEATWLAQYVGAGAHRIESCGTIQAVRIGRGRANKADPRRK